jgi:hypothetical protein
VNRDGALGIIGLVLAGAYYLVAADVPESLLADAVGPAGLPTIYAYVLAGLSLVLVGRGFTPREAEDAGRGFTAREAEDVGRGFTPREAEDVGRGFTPREAEDVGRGFTPRHARREGAPYGRAAGLLAFGVIYIAIVELVGYVVAVALLIAATVWYQGGVFKPRILLVAAGGAVLFWLMFVRLLGVQHPPGAWASFL